MDTVREVAMRLARVRFDETALSDVAASVREALDEASLPVRSGARIAVAVGSRGIGSLSLIVRSAIDWLKQRGAEPFIVPAMGSHGGATAEGQAAVLASYGVTEQAMGALVRSSMETVRLDSGDLGIDLFMDALAHASDGVLLINRVKPHTDFHGFPESGLCKMGVIGLGKHAQALAVHGLGLRGLKEKLLPAARRIFDSGKIIGGLATVENAYDRPFEIRAAKPDGIERMERDMLSVATEKMASLPLEEIDLLIVDEMGKDISGTGLDTNVIGRIRVRGAIEPSRPAIASIVATRLTEASHGNAIGIGLADVITQRLYRAIDFPATYENGLTSSFSERVKVPYVASDDVTALKAGIRFAGLDSDQDRALARARIVRIKNTLELSTIQLSPAAAEALRDRSNVAIAEKTLPLLAANGSFSRWPE